MDIDMENSRHKIVMGEIEALRVKRQQKLAERGNRDGRETKN